MSTILKDVLEGKPSKMIRIMIKGLEGAKHRDGFLVAMHTFGMEVEPGGFCFGCAAFFSLLEICGEDSLVFNGEVTFSTEYSDISDFEDVVDRLRMGFPGDAVVGRYFGFALPVPEVDLKFLLTSDWEEGIRPLEDYATQLEKVGM